MTETKFSQCHCCYNPRFLTMSLQRAFGENFLNVKATVIATLLSPLILLSSHSTHTRPIGSFNQLQPGLTEHTHTHNSALCSSVPA